MLKFAQVFLILFVTACAGTGTKNISDLSIDNNKNKTKIFFL